MSSWNDINPFGERPSSNTGSGGGTINNTTIVQNYPTVAMAVQSFYDERPPGTHGGPANMYAGTYFTRQLTAGSPALDSHSSSATIPGMMLSANQVTVPAGEYFVQGTVTGGFCAYHKARLWNVTAGSLALSGMSSYENSGVLEDGRSVFQGSIKVNTPTVYEVQHFMEGAQGYAFDQGFGYPYSVDPEVYVTLTFFKLV